MINFAASIDQTEKAHENLKVESLYSQALKEENSSNAVAYTNEKLNTAISELLQK